MIRSLNIVFDPLLPPWLLGAFALAALLIALALFRLRRQPLALLARLLAAALILLPLANPRIEKEKRQPLDDIAVIVVDDSASQHVDGRRQRAREAARLLKERLQALKGTEVRTHTLPADDGREGTRLISALREALADVPPERFAGAFLITDGRVHDVPADPKKALPPGYEAPVHALIDGRKNERDRRIVITQAPRYGIVGKEQTIRFRVEETGGNASSVEVSIRVNGEDWGRHRLKPGKTAQLALPVDHAGQNIVELSAAPMPGGELTLRNNHAVVITRGIRDRLKVLLISGEPHPGERTWRNLLKADPTVDLVHFTILRPPEKQDGTPIRELALIAFPTRELFVEKLKSFDLIIFDRYQRRAILPEFYMRNVVDYVRNGGAVLFTAGPEYASEFSLYHSPLADIATIAPMGRHRMVAYRPALSETGRRHPVTRGLKGKGLSQKSPPAWGRWLRIVPGQAAPKAQVLMTGPDNLPLLALSREGKGRVATLMSDHIWLWARKYDGGGPHVELLRRLAHWLMKEPDLEEEALQAETRGRDLVIFRRTMKDAVPPLEVTMPDGTKTTLTMRKTGPGLFTARIREAPVGLYRLRNGTLSRLTAVGEADTPETREITATEEMIRPVTQATAGGLVWITAGDEGGISLPAIVRAERGRPMAGNGWLAIQAAGASRLVAMERIPLYSALPVLALALLLLGLAWRLESR